jgi:hypothetical protein
MTPLLPERRFVAQSHNGPPAPLGCIPTIAARPEGRSEGFFADPHRTGAARPTNQEVAGLHRGPIAGMHL